MLKLILMGTLLFFTNFVLFAAQEQRKLHNPNNPVALADYRLNYDQMRELTNARRLAGRVFYVPSVGPDAAWFDAIKKGNFAEVVRMVKAGQDIEAKDTAVYGQTALGWATFIGYEDIVKYLIENNANIYAQDIADVYTIFKSAILGNNLNIVKYIYPLFKGNLDLNAQEDDGETPLMIAASNDRVEIVEYLIKEHNVKINTISQPLNQSAMSYACGRGNTKTIELLKKYGAINHKTGKSGC